MKWIAHSGVIATLLLFTGCATTFRPWLLSEIQPGMSKDQVVAVLGEPDFIEQQEDMVLLHYTYSEDFNLRPANNPFAFEDINPTLRQDAFRRSMVVYEYVVRMVDGKVLDYKEL
jgi:hypothetical protein